MNASVVPNYTFMLPFESDFYYKIYRIWMSENWTLSFYYVALYLTCVFGGQYFLRNRKAFQLRGYLTAWNMLLSIFSFVGALRCTPELLRVLRHHDLFYSVCVNSNLEVDRVTGFWSLMFVLLKVPELGDTVFMVLRTVFRTGQN